MAPPAKNTPFEIYEDPEDGDYLEDPDNLEDVVDPEDVEDAQDSDDSDDVEDIVEESRYLIDAYLWGVVTMNAPDWYCCPAYKMFLGNEDGFEEISSHTPLSFPPNLPAVLNSPTPPSIEFFRTLPKPGKGQKVFAVYKLLMEKIGQRPRVYTGSGTKATSGASARFSNYANLTNLPLGVEAALEEGFTISHVGMICWSPIPDKAAMIAKCQLRFLGLEATFSYMFFTGRPEITDPLWTDIFQWKRTQVEWDPLCTHTSLRERPRNLDVTDKQLEAYAEHARQRKRKYDPIYKAKRIAEDRTGWRKQQNGYSKALRERRIDDNAQAWRNKTNAYGRRHYAKRLLDDPVAFRTEKAASSRKSYNKDPVARAARQRDKKAAVRAAKKHYCPPCDQACDSRSALDKHKMSKKHLKKLNA